MESKWIDAHAHIPSMEDMKKRVEDGIFTMACAVSPTEAVQLSDWKKELGNPEEILLTAGLHPWQSENYTVEQMKPFLETAPVIGEIGLDHVWCQVPMKIQKEAFERQLAFAAERKKPVILHIKGCEKEAVSLLRAYPNTYLVHWYSCDDYLEEYIKLGCYFSIGPDVWWNETVRRVAKEVPMNRIFTETDGMSAVVWAYEEAVRNETAGAFLKKAAGEQKLLCPRSAGESLCLTARETAKIRGISEERLKKQMRENLGRFLYFV